MARQLTIRNGQQSSQSFVPQTSFLVYGAGLPGTPATYQVQMRPTGVSTAAWIPADTNKANANLSSSVSSALVNGSPGFEYRIQAVGTTSADVVLYWDHITSLRSVYN